MDRRAWFLLACAILIPWQLYHVVIHPQFARPPLPIGDGPDYETIGYSLSVGNGYAFAWSDPQWKAPYLADPEAQRYPHLHRDKHSGTTTSRPPFVPMVLAGLYRILGRNDVAFAAFRCLSALAIGIAGAIAVLIAFDVTRSITSDRWVARSAWLATLALALFDSTIRTYAIDFLSEPLALLWCTLFLWCGLSFEDNRKLPTKILLLALAMVAMILTRSLFVLWIPGVALILWLSIRSMASTMSLGFVVLIVLLLTPWWIRNCQLLQSFMPMGGQGAASVLGGYSDEALADWGNWHPDAEWRLRQFLESLPESGEWSNVEYERRLATAATIETRQWIKQHLQDLPTLMAMRLTTHWGPYFGKSLIWRLGMLLGVIALLMHRRWQAYWLLGLPIVSSLTIMLLYETGGRFLVPLYGLLYALAGIGVALTARYLFQGK